MKKIKDKIQILKQLEASFKKNIFTDLNLDNILKKEKIEATKFYTLFPNKTNFVCYDRDSFIRFMEQQDSIMFKWVPRDPGVVMDNVGHGGHPSGVCFRRTPDGIWITSKSFEFLKNNKEIRTFKALTMGEERVGNAQGTFGVSQLHGQLPGVTIYKLYPLSVKIIQ